MNQADVAIVGAGIIGLATAYQLLQKSPGLSIAILEKESDLALHQTGRNSGVLHSGIYYRPGSLKAKNCRTGRLMMQEFCEEHGIAHEICGKVIVASDESELPALRTIFERGQLNGVTCSLIEQDALMAIEPHVRGVKAIHVPEAGIINFRDVCLKLAEILRTQGTEFYFRHQVRRIRRESGGLVIETGHNPIHAKQVVNCAGLYADRVMAGAKTKPPAKIVPFRGEYFQLKPVDSHLCRNLIYPVPNPNFPFLGVHFTRMIGGGVECGPNAVLAFAREGYRKRDVNLRDLWDTVTYGGFLKFAAKHGATGLREMQRSFSKRAFVRALQKLIPEVSEDMLTPHRAGVRAQMISPAGEVMDDFVVKKDNDIVHVGSAPSPAATAALAIGRTIADHLA